MVNRYVRKYSTLLIIREIKIKTTMRYHLTPVRLAIVKNKNKKGKWCGEVETFFFPYYLSKHFFKFLFKLQLMNIQHNISFRWTIWKWNFFLKFINLRNSANGWRAEREREREDPKQAPHCQCKARCWAWTHKLWNHDLNWSRTFNWLSHPGTPEIKLL